MRAVKIRAVNEGRRLKDVVADLIRSGLAQPAPSRAALTRVNVPLINCVHAARPEEEMTPERVEGILAYSEAAAARQSS